MLKPRSTTNARVTPSGTDGWRLEIFPGKEGCYRLAQVDDYARVPRRSLPHKPPVSIHLRLRASSVHIPGTWGFGFWNDPFGLSLGFGGAHQLPVLPQAAWFFFASPPNHLSLYDELPAYGSLAAVFQSRNIPPAWLALCAPGLPLLALPTASRIARRLARRLIRQDALELTMNPMDWHEFELAWEPEIVTFSLDSATVFVTNLSPVGRLGLVIWVDNQFAAWRTDGRLRWGTLENLEVAWIEAQVLSID
jgi:hypothetical protein